MKVIISITRLTEYTSIVEMDEKKYIELQEELESGEYKEATEELNGLIDTDDWQDDQFHSLDEFEPYREDP